MLFKGKLLALLLILFLVVSPAETALSYTGGINIGSLGTQGQNMITTIAAGYDFSVALKSDGSVWAWGKNDYGQLGNGTTQNSAYPVQVKGPNGTGYLTGVIAITTGDYHALALKADGTVWTWGYNGSSTGTVYPVQVFTDAITIAAWEKQSVAIKSDGTLWIWNVGASPALWNTTYGLSNVVSIAGGHGHYLFLQSNGSVWAMGSNNYGQVGDGTSGTSNTRYYPVQVHGPNNVGTLGDVIAIAAGPDTSFALKSDGSLWGWGYNYWGNLGDGTRVDHSFPVQAQISNVSAVAANSLHTLIVKSDGSLWAAGNNTYGLLGNGTTSNSSIPVQVKAPDGVNGLTGIVSAAANIYSSIALKSDGSLWAWGWNNTNQVGDGTRTQRNLPVQVKGPEGVDYLTDIRIQRSYIPLATQSVSAFPNPVTIIAGQNQQLTVTANMSDGSTQNVTGSATYQSSDAAKATVSSAGLITGQSQGSTTITVTYQGQTTTVPVTIQAPVVESITVDPLSVTLPAGRTQQLTVTANMSDGTSQDVTGTATYQTSDAAKATASASGIIAGIAQGSVTITVAYQGQTATVPVTIQAPIVESLAVSPSSVTVPAGRTQQLTVTANLSDGSTQDVTNTATYQSNNTSKATITSSGLLTGKAQGSATITVSYQGKTAAVPVTVQPPLVESLTVNPASVSVAAGLTQQLAVIATLSDGTIRDVTGSAAYQTSDASIATVSGSGLVTGVAEGNAIVMVSYQGQNVNVPVTVEPPVLVSISSGLNSVSIQAGQTQPLTVVAHYSDGTTQDVTGAASFQSSNSGVATVDGSGVITAVEAGNANITITYQDKSVSVPVTVTGTAQVIVRPASMTLIKGNSQRVNVLEAYPGGYSLDVTSSCTFASSAPDVAPVDLFGLVTGKDEGNATITVTYKGVNYEIPVTVTPLKVDRKQRPGGSTSMSPVDSTTRPTSGSTTVSGQDRQTSTPGTTTSQDRPDSGNTVVSGQQRTVSDPDTVSSESRPSDGDTAVSGQQRTTSDPTVSTGSRTDVTDPDLLAQQRSSDTTVTVVRKQR